MVKRIGLLGGSFDPIHFGHLISARAVAEMLNLTKLIFLPSAHPPHKNARELSSVGHCAEMIRLAIASEPLFEFSDFDLRQAGPTYSIHTIDHFRDHYQDGAELFWVIGCDSLADLHNWHRVSELVDRVRVVTAVRPGWERPAESVLSGALSRAQIERLMRDVMETPRIEISATDIRKRVREGRSIRYLVPDEVRSYIEQRRLYIDPATSPGG